MLAIRLLTYDLIYLYILQILNCEQDLMLCIRPCRIFYQALSMFIEFILKGGFSFRRAILFLYKIKLKLQGSLQFYKLNPYSNADNWQSLQQVKVSIQVLVFYIRLYQNLRWHRSDNFCRHVIQKDNIVLLTFKTEL